MELGSLTLSLRNPTRSANLDLLHLSSDLTASLCADSATSPPARRHKTVFPHSRNA